MYSFTVKPRGKWKQRVEQGGLSSLEECENFLFWFSIQPSYSLLEFRYSISAGIYTASE